MTDFQTNKRQLRHRFLPATQVSEGNLVLIHSIGFGMDEWNRIVPFLNDRYNVLSIGLPGHDDDEHGDSGVAIPVLLEQLQSITSRYFEAPFYITGNPGIGYLGVRYARAFPESVSGLILISPFPNFIENESKLDIIFRLREHSSQGRERLGRFILSHFTLRQDEETQSELMKLFLSVPEQAFFNYVDLYFDESNSIARPKLDVPTLIMAGARETLFPPSIHGVTATVMNKAKLCVVPDAATLVAYDNPEYSAKEIDRFIRETKQADRASVYGFPGVDGNVLKMFGPESRGKQAAGSLIVDLLYTFRVYAGVAEIKQGWHVRQAASLLMFLLINGGSSRDEIAETFWPHLGLSKAKNQLRVSISHLKTLIGDSLAGGFLHIDRKRVELRGAVVSDGLAFIHKLKEAHEEPHPETRFAKSVPLLETLPKKLLTHIHDEWFMPIRDAIETQYCELCEFVAETYRMRGRKDKAALYLGKAYALCPYWTENKPSDVDAGAV